MTPKKTPKETKGGRPKSALRLTSILFKADEKTLALLDDLTRDGEGEGGALQGNRSQAIRQAIRVAHAARTARPGGSGGGA